MRVQYGGQTARAKDMVSRNFSPTYSPGHRNLSTAYLQCVRESERVRE